MDYTRANPSPRYRQLMVQYSDMHDRGDQLNNIPAERTFEGVSLIEHVLRVKALIDRHAAKSLLDYGCGKASGYEKAAVRTPDGREIRGLKAIWGINDIRLFDPAYQPHSTPPQGTYDGVISTDVLEHCPEEDVPWIVADLFSFSRKFVFASVALYPARKLLPSGDNAHITLKSAGWWIDFFERESARRGGAVRYTLAVARTNKDWLFVDG